MQGQNQNKPLRAKLCLLLLCLLLNVVLIIGVTYGRYRQDFQPATYPFVADSTGSLVLGGVVTQDWVDKGTWPAVATDWTVTENTAQLDFSISNGKSLEKYAQRNQTAVVRLVAGLGIAAPENITVTLTYEQNGQSVTLTGEPERVSEGSLVHQNYGAGWVYRFYDTTGREKAFAIDGGQLSYRNLMVTVAGETDPILYQLQVVGNYTD